jgi:hypothetical protein
MRCRVTDTVNDCWKLHPERLPAVAEIDVLEVADDASMRIAGD